METLVQNPIFNQLAVAMANYPDRSQANKDDPLLVAKLFDIAGSASWYLTEYDQVNHIAFCYVTGLVEDEWGCTSIDELSELLRLGIPRIEVDRHFKPMLFSEFQKHYKSGVLTPSGDGTHGPSLGNAGADAIDDEAPGNLVPIDPSELEVSSDMSIQDFLANFSDSLMDAVKSQNPPVFHGRNPEWDAYLGTLLRKPFEKQSDVIHAITQLLFEKGQPAGVINGEMGTGKTLMGIAVAALAHKLGYARTLVLAPPHLVYKWRREIKETVPKARVWILNGPDTLKKLLQMRALLGEGKPEHPEFFVLGRVRMRMGFHWRPAFNIRHTKAQTTSGDFLRHHWATCPDCGVVLSKPGEDGEIPLTAQDAQLHLADARRSCSACDSPLWTLMHKGQVQKSRKDLVSAALQQLPTIGTKRADQLIERFGEQMLGSMLEDNVYELINLMDGDGELVFSDRQAKRMERALASMEFSFGEGGYQPTEFIKRYLPQGYFSLLIPDEGHEYKNEGSAQGQAMGVLARKCTKCVLLTGTLMGGYADDLFYLLWRINPQMMLEDGYGYNARNTLGSAAMEFMRHHGVIKDIYKDSSDTKSHKTARGKSVTHRTAKCPGFGPAGIMRYILPITAFLRLKDLGEGILPPYEEFFIECGMSDEQSVWYNRMAMSLKDALKKALVAGDRSLLGTVLNALLAWPDCAFRPEVVTHPHHRNRVLASVPVVFGEGEYAPKELDLLRICREEKAEGRRVLAYTVYTGTRDTTARLKTMLEANGFKVAVLRATVPAEKREDWLFEQVDRGVEVILTNPELVKTGLDMLEFPTIVFMNTGFNVYTVLQAARRSWRIGQKNNVKVYFLGYRNTAQLTCLELMAKKIAVSQSTSGDMPDSGLDILNQSEDSTEMALAKQLIAV